MRDFESRWPKTFYGTLKKITVSMAASEKVVKIGGTPVYDIDDMCTRFLELQQCHNLNITDILTYELSAALPELFKESTYSGDIKSSNNPSRCQNH